MNTFISLWKEETNETFEEVIEKSKLVLNLIEKLKLILLETPPYDLQDKKVKQYQGSIQELQELLHFKFNVATELLLRQASTLADLDSGNMEKIIQHENITLYLWANLKKNPSIKNYKDYTNVENGYNIIIKPKTIKIMEEEVGTVLKKLASAVAESEAIKSEVEMKLLSETVSAAQLLLIENAYEKPEFFEAYEVDLFQFTTLGGVYHLDILELPPQCKPVNGWMIVEILKEGLQKYVYPPETTEDFEIENAFPPIEVTLQVHENVIFFEDPMVARWDHEGKHWRTDGISHVIYNSEDKLVTFNLETFGPVTLIQDAHINMPYQSWELRPLAVNKVLLTVTTVFTELQIQIKENLCMLASIKLKNKEHESILKGRWMPPIPFIIALKEVGLNIFPTGHSHFYVLINNKAALVELKAYRQMALLSSAFAFSWSKWNISCGSSKVVFQVKEHLNQELDTEYPDWALLMFSGDRAQRLKISEYSETFSEALQEETEFHSTLYHMVKDFASGDAIEKIRSSNCQFVDCVCQMLLSTRLLSYS
ncbi:dynein axonemal intermediate chain 7 [Trichechus manatus latirostris]|uniref:Dynein axonemal intermediate chain 7 n=1 Tax=Trichechus manatus latirostris TaxID=127582 RepID=A0A2Y9RJV9_TRIMA|nr:dynein axonemal intermediate chain 7 [Trichechus manatus latirostris]